MRTLNFLSHSFMICMLLKTIICDHDYVVVLERNENIDANNDELITFSQLHVIRKGSNYLINGTFSVLQDLDASVTTEIKSECSPLGDSRFIKYPYAVDKQSICDFFDMTYKKYFEPSLNGRSNCPTSVCPIPKGTYYIDHADIKLDPFPTHVNRGLWKMEQKYYKEDKFVGGLQLFFYVKEKQK